MYKKRQIETLVAVPAICIAVWLVAVSMTQAQSDGWERGKLIGLRAGTCIREGPGLNYRAHTRVPENDWIVMVMDGPRQANDKTWYDTSRRAAGDVSGGTGWVMADWNDTDCTNPPPATVAPIDPPSPPLPAPSPSPTPTGDVGDMLQRMRSWWNAQAEVIKWFVAIILLVIIIVVWRRVSASLVGLMLAIIESLIIWWVLDQTRAAWQEVWQGLVGTNAPDLAILIALIPLVIWMLSLLRKRAA
ncbi:MAG: hypothetical protein WBD79_20215 [Anaerolineae bacterium]